MPEKKRRRVVKGLREAAKHFEEYVSQRVQAENSTGQLVRELERLARATRAGLDAQRREGR